MNSDERDYADALLDHFGKCTPAQALQLLGQCLEQAAKLHAENPTNRKGAKVAMEVLTGFAQARFGLHIAAIFGALYEGLEDLDKGAVLPLLRKHYTAGVGNRPPDTRHRRVVKILATAAPSVPMMMRQTPAGSLPLGA